MMLMPRSWSPMDPILPLRAPPTDPFYQGLDHASRLYIHHYATKLCSDMAISDITDTINPFRDVVPLCRDHPILLHTITANAAFHISDLHRRGLCLARSDSAAGTIQHYASNHTFSRAEIDALSAKQKALVLLRRALGNIADIDVDLTVTVIHLFIISELISPCQDGWMAHVQGALRLISCYQSLESCPTSPAAFIRDSVTSDCLTYYVLGSTLMNTSTLSLSNPFIFSSDIIASLTRAEANSYLSLPTPLLQILFEACELSNLVALSTMLDIPDSHSDSDSDSNLIQFQTRARALLHATAAFNVNAWAASLEGTSTSLRTTSRIHTALAHQNAVKIYICRAVDVGTNTTSPSSSSMLLGEDPNRLVTNIITHLSLVPPSDPIFKATSWPTFIAGAETDNPVYRRWAAERLDEFWNLIPWGYVRTAGEVMRTTWRLRDEASGGEGDGGGGGGLSGNGKRRGRGSWVQQLKGLERYWLIA
ncbi:transcription factor domain-containing protein [Aspergillus undulatus]|uniref:transcription factor domain-containing protein n=1 Tax=Aspergillus undulatus TaxID=1810928 RepID=UPI003CCE48BF